MLSGQVEGVEHERSSSANGADADHEEPVPRARSQHTAPSAKHRPGKHIDGYNALDEMDDESDAPSSGNEWDSGAEDEPDDQADDDDEEDEVEMSDENNYIAQQEGSEDEVDERSHSLVVSLRYSRIESSPLPKEATNNSSALKQTNVASAPGSDRTDHIHAVQDVPNAVRPKIVDEISRPVEDAPKHLPPTYIPTTILPAISAKSFDEYKHKMPVTLPPAQNEQPPLDAPRGPISAPPREMLDSEDSYPSFSEPQLPTEKAPSIDFHQYQYQPPMQ